MMLPAPRMPSPEYRLALMVAVILAVAGLLAIVSSPSVPTAAAQGGAPATANITVRDGANPGEVVVSWDAVPEATHYRIGYVNMVQDYPLAKDSVTGEWIEAFVYVDVNARNFAVSGGRAEYTVRRLAQGVRHAFTVLTSSDFMDTGGGGSVSSTFAWPPIGSRWQFHTVADRGGACPGVGHASASADLGRASSGIRPAASPAGSGSSIGQGDPGPPPDVPFERRHITLDAPPIGALSGEVGNDRFAGQTGPARVAARSNAPPVTNIRVVDGPNPGDVVISWDAVPEATHYRIGYVNMVQDYPLAKASVTREWIEAFVYVDVNARNFTVSGGQAQYVIRRLAQGDRHAFTVLTSSNHINTTESFNSEFSWPSNPRWQFHEVADHGGACPTTGVPIVTPPAVVTTLDGLEHGAWLELNRPQAATAIRALPWVGDGINGSELQAAEALIATARWYPDVFSSLMQMSWLGDGVTDAEAIAVVYMRHTAFLDSESPGADLAGQMLAKSWVQDAISADEATVIRFIYWIIRYDTDSPPPMHVIAAVNAAASRILAMPFLASVESPDALAVRSLERIEDISKTDFLQIMARPTLNDGITDEEAEIVLLLGATYQNADRALVDTLLDPNRITVEKRAIRLPRSGEMDLAIIRTAPGPARGMDLLEHSVRSIEEFMGTPFPTNHVAVLVEEAVSEGAAGTHFGTHIAMLPKYDVDDGSQLANILPSLTAHEVAHYYWRGNETWIDEGGATFMEFPVENMRTGRGLIADRYPCPYVSSIAEVVALDPERGSRENICNYSLGERIFLDLYRNLGDAAYRRGFSSLYQRSQVLDEYLWPTELNVSHVRDAFQPLSSAATDVITRWYDGPRPQGIAPPDTGPVVPELATIAGGQVVNAFVGLEEDDWDAFGGWESFIAKGTENFSVADAAGKQVFLYLGFTVPVTVEPKILRLEVIEHYEDGFLYDDYVAPLEFEPEWNRVWWRLRIGPRTDDPWLPGRYWVFLYDGERKVAEVTYEVTP
ncbi:MAG: hypothetical protein OXU28_03745 [Chloroflexota bacterium]|nr:hypothetical protein [Chloroflexota bacterium]